MVVDLEATKKRFNDSGRKFVSYARAKGLDTAAFQQKMAGRSQFDAADLEALKSDGLLVYK